MITLHDLLHIAKIYEVFEDYGTYTEDKDNFKYFASPYGIYYLEANKDEGFLKSARLFELGSGRDSCIYEYNHRHPTRPDYDKNGMEGFFKAVRDLDISFQDELESFFSQKSSYQLTPHQIKKQSN